MMEEIIVALLLAHPADLETFRKYIVWMRFRRRVNDTFYPARHWTKPGHPYHWIGK